MNVVQPLAIVTARFRFSLCLLAFVAAALVARTSQAQTEPKNFPVERLQLAIDRDGLIDVEWGALAQPGTWSALLMLDYEKNPLVLYQLSDGKRLGSLINNRFDGSVGGSFVFLKWLEVGAEVPVVLYQGRASNQPAVANGDLGRLGSIGFGDIRLVPKFGILREKKYWLDLALLAGVTFPTGGVRNYFGENGFTFQPTVALSKTIGEGLRLAVNVGATIRRSSQILNQLVESEGTYSLGAGYRFRRPWEVDATLDGAFSLERPFRHSNENALELRAQAGYQVHPWVFPFLGAGVGLVHAWGVPDWRVFIGVRLGPTAKPAPAPVVHVETDRDHDGILDKDDLCPDVFGIRENRGCPDKDTDQDGIVDRLDQCPTEPGPAWNHGCPDPDTDKDGVLNVDDQCPTVPGPVENHGCPDTDRDGDGVVDRLDKCPDEPGPASNAGCKQLVVVQANKLELLDNVHFETGKAVIKEESFKLLDNVVRVLVAHPEIKNVRVEGHTDNQGSAKLNLRLSDQRAKAVVVYLIDHGVDAKTLVSKGYGQTRPVASNSTSAGRAKNRRVDFVIEAK